MVIINSIFFSFKYSNFGQILNKGKIHKNDLLISNNDCGMKTIPYPVILPQIQLIAHLRNNLRFFPLYNLIQNYCVQ